MKKGKEGKMRFKQPGVWDGRRRKAHKVSEREVGVVTAIEGSIAAATTADSRGREETHLRNTTTSPDPKATKVPRFTTAAASNPRSSATDAMSSGLA